VWSLRLTCTIPSHLVCASSLDHAVLCDGTSYEALLLSFSGWCGYGIEGMLTNEKSFTLKTQALVSSHRGVMVPTLFHRVKSILSHIILQLQKSDPAASMKLFAHASTIEICKRLSAQISPAKIRALKPSNSAQLHVWALVICGYIK